MAGGYTANYGLCQWQPTDKFLREEFNGDNAKIDAALKAAEERAEEKAQAAETKADRALSGLEDQSYNVYNLILQNDYEGKYTGYKKALLYDGFLDESGVQAASDGFLWSQGQYTLSTQGESDRDVGFSTSRGTTEMSSDTFTAQGNGNWTGFTCKVYNSSSATLNDKINYTLIVNGVTVLTGSSGNVSLGSRASKEYTITFSKAVTLAKGDAYQIHLKGGNVDFIFYYNDGGYMLGGLFLIQPLAASAGTLTTVSRRSLPACGGLLAWVRHTTGVGVTLSLAGTDDEMQSFTLEGSRITQNLQKVSCTESTFRLDAAQTEGGYVLTLGMDLGAQSLGRVYDYGMVLLP